MKKLVAVSGAKPSEVSTDKSINKNVWQQTANYMQIQLEMFLCIILCIVVQQKTN